jgi:hypothetical protein
MDRDRELQRLADADRHIRDAERNVSEQRLQLKKRLQQGRSDANAQRILEASEAALVNLQEHRMGIIRTIDRIDKGSASLRRLQSR